MLKSHRLTAALALCAALLPAAHAAEPKIAVTDLAYEERVSEYFRVVSASSKSSMSASSSMRDGPSSYSERGQVNARSQSSYYEAEGTYSYIEYGELRKYTADLKGAMLKGGGVKLVQAKSYQGKPTEKVFDIISRIKQGYFRGGLRAVRHGQRHPVQPERHVVRRRIHLGDAGPGYRGGLQPDQHPHL